MDTDTLLQVASPKMLDRFSIWDIILQKAKIQSSLGTSAMETILNDCNVILSELKLLIESCLEPIRIGKAQLELKNDRHVSIRL